MFKELDHLQRESGRSRLGGILLYKSAKNCSRAEAGLACHGIVSLSHDQAHIHACIKPSSRAGDWGPSPLRIPCAQASRFGSFF